jgi:hypothetical protein
MRHPLLLLTPLLLLFACQPKPAAPSDKQTADAPADRADKPAKPPVESAPKYEVHGYVETLGSYCGGAAPSREMMEEMSKPKPSVGTKIYFRKGKVNDLSQPIVDSLVVDDQGNYSINLPNGDFVMLLPEMRDSSAIKSWRAKESKIRVASEECLKDWFRKGIIAINVMDGSLNVANITLEKPCMLPLGSVCLRWDGPRPQ